MSEVAEVKNPAYSGRGDDCGAAGSRALFLGCSRRKITSPGLLPAIDRYDGPYYRVLRKYLRGLPEKPPIVWILSAQYGLIRGDKKIPWYDRPMTVDRAQELRLRIQVAMKDVVTPIPAMDVFVCMGAIYVRAMSDCWTLFSKDTQIHFAEGAIGGRSCQLGAWLREQSANPCTHYKVSAKNVGKARISGLRIRRSLQDILADARTWLLEDGARAFKYQTWYVQVDQHKVSAKWLVSRLSRLPVSQFRTADARRVLTSLGVTVEHL